MKNNSSNNEEFIDKLKNFKVNIYDTRGFKNAFVTNGGVLLKEVDPKNFKIKIKPPKYHFCGEVLDISAYTGGFNITAALSTGYTAGKNINI